MSGMRRASSLINPKRIPSSAFAKRTIQSHSRTYENTVRDGDVQERERMRERGDGPGPTWTPGFLLTSPRQLVQYLDTFIVGQERAKKVLSVAVFNHYNRVRAKLQSQLQSEDEESASQPSSRWDNSDHSVNESAVPPHLDLRPHPNRRSLAQGMGALEEQNSPFTLPHPTVPLFEKSNVLLMGPTGSGKTLLARTLARVLDVPFAMSDATTLTQAGYVGEDVEMCVHRLLQASNWDVQRASVGIIVLDEADKLARRSGSASDATRDVSGEGVQQGLLRMLEGSVVNVNAKGVEGSGGGDIVGPGSSPPGFGGRSKKGPSSPSAAPRSETYQVDTTDILFILSGAFVGLDKVVQQRLAKGSIGFGAALASDGLSRTSSKSASPMPFFTRNSEPREVNPYELVEPTDLIKYGFIPEFTSRVPTITALNPLTTSDLMRVLTEVRGSLAKQYEALFGYSGVEIRFTTPALREICEIAVKRGMGARGLRGIMESLLLESMYDVPGSSVRYVLVDLAVVQGKRPAIYYSRGEGGAFYGALAAEEELDAKQRQPNKADKVAQYDAVLDAEVRKDLETREGEREKKPRARRGSSGGSGFP